MNQFGKRHSVFATLLILLMLQTRIAAAESPFLWRIEPAQPATAPSWLFGTIHSAHPEMNRLPASVSDSFNKAEAFYAELDMSTDNIATATQAFLRADGSTLKGSLSPRQNQRINSILAAIHPSLNIVAFDSLKTWAFMANVSLLEEQLEFGIRPAMDMKLYLAAASAGKHVGGLETIAEQTGVFEAFSDHEIEQMLELTLTYIETSQRRGKPVLSETYAAYRSGDTGEFARLMESQMPMPEALKLKFTRLLLSDRNQRMAKRIDGLLRQHPEQSQFFAVGAAHFSGPSGLQALLRQRGYRITRVRR